MSDAADTRCHAHRAPRHTDDGNPGKRRPGINGRSSPPRPSTTTSYARFGGRPASSGCSEATRIGGSSRRRPSAEPVAFRWVVLAGRRKSSLTLHNGESRL